MVSEEIEWSGIDPSSEDARALLQAHRDGTIIEINHKRCVVLDVYWPRGGDALKLLIEYVD
jgi:hypothetical protein